MKEQNQDSSGAITEASGDGVNQSQEQEAKGPVQYETYKKVLHEKKKRDEELEKTRQELLEFKKREKERLETELKAKEDYKKLVELREKELQEERSQREALQRDLQESIKLDSFLKALPGKVDEAYFRLIDTSEIVVNPETGLPDETSVLQAAKKFEATYGLVIQKQGAARIPGGAAQSGVGQISLEQWKALPLKEKKERLKDVVAAHKRN